MKVERLKQLLRYDPASGTFTWIAKAARNTRIGAVAGSSHGEGYVEIQVDGERFLAHRLAWLYQTGELPSAQLDHVNGVRNDNRWENLRAASPSINAQNKRRAQVDNKVGLLGVSPDGVRFKASISSDGRPKHLGCFGTAAEAHAAYVAAKRELHPGCTL